MKYNFNVKELVIQYHKLMKHVKPYDPLDGDEVDDLVAHIKNEVNLHQGNITEAEFYDIEAKSYNIQPSEMVDIVRVKCPNCKRKVLADKWSCGCIFGHCETCLKDFEYTKNCTMGNGRKIIK